MTRRRFLTVGAGVATGVAATEPTGTSAASPAPAASSDGERRSPAELDHVEARDVRHVRERFDDQDVDVVDGVADLGLDATGQQDVSGQLRQAARRGELVELPPGDYMVRSTVAVDGASGWGIRGTGDSPRDVRLHAPGASLLVEQRGGRDVRLENLAMVNGTGGSVGRALNDGRGSPRGVGVTLTVDDGITVRDVEHIGVSPREGVSGDMEEFNHQEGSLTLQVMNPDGVGVVENFRKTSPTEISGHAENDAAMNAWAAHRGVVYVRNSRFANSGGDGVTYLSRCPGGYRFTDCTFRSFTASALRLGGGTSWARRCTIVMDLAAVRQRNAVLPGYTPSMNGIVWESASAVAPGGRNEAGGLIDGCRIVMRAVAGSRGGIVVDGSAGGLVVRNTTVVNQTNRRSVSAEAPGDSFMNDFETPEGPHPLYLRNVTLSGGGTGAAIDTDRQVVATGLDVAMPNGGVTGPVDRGTGGGRPAFADRLLGLQGDVPGPADAVGATGNVSAPLPAAGGVGPAARRRRQQRKKGVVATATSVMATAAVAVLLLVGLAAVVPAALLSYLLE
jgi:hypothetical protein